MAVRRLRARGQASPAVVWERYERIALWPTWSPQIWRVEADAPRIGAGVHGTVVVPGGLGLPFTVTAVDPAARSWTWVVRLGPVALTLTHAVQAAAVGSGTTLMMEGPGALLLGYAPVAGVALRRLVAR
ncbi:SRPBCC family protein [uncultured Friedmanniella sp.]|uniref:SRPBCC family protein n=1 Tax=uncultured Friedmanniella sp. TaxID=335381 RepID=UPI0035CAB8A8